MLFALRPFPICSPPSRSKCSLYRLLLASCRSALVLRSSPNTHTLPVVQERLCSEKAPRERWSGVTPAVTLGPPSAAKKSPVLHLGNEETKTPGVSCRVRGGGLFFINVAKFDPPWARENMTCPSTPLRLAVAHAIENRPATLIPTVYWAQ
jgi:hypothetical protein